MKDNYNTAKIKNNFKNQKSMTVSRENKRTVLYLKKPSHKDWGEKAIYNYKIMSSFHLALYGIIYLLVF